MRKPNQRLLGTLVNNASNPIQVTTTTTRRSRWWCRLTGTFPFDTVESLLRPASYAPGTRTMLTASTEAGEVEISVPVVDGTLDPYRPYLPS